MREKYRLHRRTRATLGLEAAHGLTISHSEDEEMLFITDYKTQTVYKTTLSIPAVTLIYQQEQRYPRMVMCTSPMAMAHLTLFSTM